MGKGKGIMSEAEEPVRKTVHFPRVATGKTHISQRGHICQC